MNTGRIPPARLRHLAARIHTLGPWPLFCLLRELSEGADLPDVLERYATLHPLRDFIREFGGHEMPQPRIIEGGRR
jgi:hypothetical protein